MADLIYEAEHLLVSPSREQEKEIYQGLTYALQGSDAQTQAGLLIELCDYLPKTLQAEVIRKALNAVKAIPDEVERLRYLQCLAPKLSPNLLLEALELGKAIPTKMSCIRAMKALAPKLPEAISEAMAAARHTQSGLPPEQLLEAVVIASRLPEERDRITALIALSDPLSKMPERDLSSLWPAILHSLSSSLAQRDLLRGVLALSAVIYKLGDSLTVARTIVALQELGQWWPQD